MEHVGFWASVRGKIVVIIAACLLTAVVISVVSLAALASVALSVAGVVAQRWCRRPHDDDAPGSSELETT